MKKIHIILLFLSIVSLSLISACNPQEETIKIGFSSPLTGDVAVWGVPGQKAALLAAEKINKEGGINGITLEIVSEDDKCNGKDGVSAVTKLTSVDKVKAVMTLCSSVSVPAYPVAEQSGAIMMSYASSSPDLTHDTPYFFRTFPSDALQGRVGAELALERSSKIGVFHVNDEYGSAFKKVFVENIENNGGEVVSLETYTPGDIDFKTQVQKLKKAAPELIYLISFPKEGSLIIKQAREAGLRTPIMGTEAVFESEFLQNTAEAAEGLVVTYPQSPEGKPANSEFVRDYKAKYGEDPNTFSAESYDGVMLLGKAMKECGVSQDEMKRCLDNMPPYEGASGVIVFDEFGDAQKIYDVYEVRNGEFVKISQ